MEKDECYHLKIKIADFPRNRENTLKSFEELNYKVLKNKC
jgi:hypothetical protein